MRCVGVYVLLESLVPFLSDVLESRVPFLSDDQSTRRKDPSFSITTAEGWRVKELPLVCCWKSWLSSSPWSWCSTIGTTEKRSSSWSWCSTIGTTEDSYTPTHTHTHTPTLIFDGCWWPCQKRWQRGTLIINLWTCWLAVSWHSPLPGWTRQESSSEHSGRSFCILFWVILFVFINFVVGQMVVALTVGRVGIYPKIFEVLSWVLPTLTTCRFMWCKVL